VLLGEVGRAGSENQRFSNRPAGLVCWIEVGSAHFRSSNQLQIRANVDELDESALRNFKIFTNKNRALG
jgi:hypothetical protein